MTGEREGVCEVRVYISQRQRASQSQYIQVGRTGLVWRVILYVFTTEKGKKEAVQAKRG